MSEITDQNPEPDHYLLHISDTHFVEKGELLHGAVDSEANLRRMLGGLVEGGSRPEAMIFTGDLANVESVDVYRRLRDTVEPIADELDAQLIWVMGNHDERGSFRVGLLGEPASQEPVDRVYDVNGLRIVALDTSVPGHQHGEIAEEQLEWLRGVLATPAPDGTLLALHHPPVPSPISLVQLAELRDQSGLAELLPGTDVRAILGGHLHYSTTSTFAGVPVSVASATCYTQDLQTSFPAARGQDGGQSYNLVHVYRDRVMHSVVPVGPFPTVYEFSAEQFASFLATTREHERDSAAQ